MGKAFDSMCKQIEYLTKKVTPYVIEEFDLLINLKKFINSAALFEIPQNKIT